MYQVSTWVFRQRRERKDNIIMVTILIMAIMPTMVILPSDASVYVKLSTINRCFPSQHCWLCVPPKARFGQLNTSIIT